jgi:ADP-ribose pyrophosphatase YjhB (NUDIX family)
MRTYPERPIVAVGAVVVDGDRVLLVKRANEPLKGEWSLPGGAVEIGETLAGALVREAREETGLDVEVGPVVDVLDRIVRDAAGRIEYLCRPRSGIAVSGSDADDVRWAGENELPDLHLTARVMSVIEKARGLAWERR